MRKLPQSLRELMQYKKDRWPVRITTIRYNDRTSIQVWELGDERLVVRWYKMSIVKWRGTQRSFDDITRRHLNNAFKNKAIRYDAWKPSYA